MEAWSPEKFEENKILENDEYEEDDYYESDESESEHSFISFDSNDKDSLTASKFGQVIPKSTKWNKKLNEVIDELKKNRVSELKTSIPGDDEKRCLIPQAHSTSRSTTGTCLMWIRWNVCLTPHIPSTSLLTTGTFPK